METSRGLLTCLVNSRSIKRKYITLLIKLNNKMFLRDVKVKREKRVPIYLK